MADREVIYKNQGTIRQLSKRMPATFVEGSHGKGFTSVPDGQERIIYEVSVDRSALHHMARKAAGNKSGVANDGALRVRVVERHRIPAEGYQGTQQ
jgi:hypothetical protein